MPRKPKAEAGPPQVGDKVYPPNSQLVHAITRVSHDGQQVDLEVPGTLLTRFRVPTDRLTFVERKPPAKTSNPFTTAEPVFDGEEILNQLHNQQLESLKQADGDIDILKAYLKKERAPKAAIEALEELTIDQHKAWKVAIGKIKKALGE